MKPQKRRVPAKFQRPTVPGYFCHPLARVLWHRERQIRWEAADPRLWADEAVPLAERGQSLLKTLGRVRDRALGEELGQLGKRVL